MGVRKIVIWNEQEATAVCVRAWEISQRASLSQVNLFLQAQREVLRNDRHRKIQSSTNLGDYVVALWRELLSFSNEKAAHYVAAWNAKKITPSFEPRLRGMHAKNALPPELPKFGWDWQEPGATVLPVKVKGPSDPIVDHNDLHRQAQAALAKEQDVQEAVEPKPQAPTPDLPNAIMAAVAEGPGVAPQPVAPTSKPFAINDDARKAFVGALTDYVRHLLHQDLEIAVRQVAHEMGETLVRPIVRPIVADMVQAEVLPLVNETVSVGLNNALVSMGQTLREEMEDLTSPHAKPAPTGDAPSEEAAKDTSILHYVIIFGLQPDEFMRAVSVVMPYAKYRIQVVHAKDLRGVHQNLRSDTKLIHMIKMSAHLSSDIKERVGRTYPVNGGVSEAKKVLLDIVNGTNLMPSY